MDELISAELIISPEGNVYLREHSGANEQLPISIFQKIESLFARGDSYGLLHLGIVEFLHPLPMSFLFWQTFGRHFISSVCKLTQGTSSEELPAIAPPDFQELQDLLGQALLIKGFEYLTPEVMISLWKKLENALRQELIEYANNVQAYLQRFNPSWNLVGRVCFHLAEKKDDEKHPFAFLATYTTQLSRATPQHLPLKRALQDYSGEANRQALLALLLPMQKAAEQSAFLRELVDSGRVFHPQIWTPNDAHRFLKDIPIMEASGLMVRVPNWWNSQKPVRPKVTITVGEKQQAGVGWEALLDFDLHLSLGDGQQLTAEEWNLLQNCKGGLVKIKERWVEIDPEKLKEVLTHWNKLQNATKDGISMSEGLRLLAGTSSQFLKEDKALAEATVEWSVVKAGSWLKEVLEELRSPENSKSRDDQAIKILKQYLQASLRPYQEAGVLWLWQLYQLKLGGCLADDMGLGKTIQVLALLLLAKHHSAFSTSPLRPHLLVVPASLLGNWQSESARFAPTLKIFTVHGSAGHEGGYSDFNAEMLASYDVVITTYAYTHRLEWLKEVNWNLVILDEAQLIKNAGAKQTRAVKTLRSQSRIILTGTPVENKLADLWSLFDFTSPGLLGSSKDFSNYSKQVNKDSFGSHQKRFILALRTLTQPYILRRLKSDKKVIADLPEKTEMQTYCTLSKAQIKLYQQAINELEKQLKNDKMSAIHRRGLVLSYIFRFKQICNHPTQWLGYGDYNVQESGKFIRLKGICEEIAAKQEKVLVFTQFKEIIPALEHLLEQVFSRKGLTLHGDTPVKKRVELVDSFQQEQGPPFFVLSLKAGGTGLTLTRASHVIHFDRWWNPAVENQATDRAYRIGQKHPVMVHKFICQGTIEDKIDGMINTKKELSRNLFEGDDEILLTELSNDDLLRVLSLDINRVLAED